MVRLWRVHQVWFTALLQNYQNNYNYGKRKKTDTLRGA